MSVVDDFFKKKRQESESVTQPTGTANFSMDSSAARANETQSSSIPSPSKPLDIQPAEAMPISQMPRQSRADSGMGTTSIGQGVAIDQTPTIQKEADTEARERELVAQSKQEGYLFIQKLGPEDRSLLVSGLEREKNRKDILREYDPSTDAPVDTKPYWQDPTQLRQVTGARLGNLGMQDNSNYAEEQFRAGGRSGLTFGYDQKLQNAFGAPTQDPGAPQNTGEGITRIGGTLVGNAVNPATWGIFGGASKLVTPALGDTLAGGLATDTLAGGAIGGLWNTGENVGTMEDAKKRLEGLAVGAASSLVLSGMLRGAGAGIDFAAGKDVRLTKETGIRKGSPSSEIFGADGKSLSPDSWEAQTIKYVPESNSYLIHPQAAADGAIAPWYAEIDAATPDKGRIWSNDGFKKLDFQKTPDGIEVNTTEWVRPEFVKQLENSNIQDLPAIFSKIGSAPKPDAPTPPAVLRVSYQSAPTKSEGITKIQNSQPNLTTGILDELGDRKTVSKEFIQNLTNRGEIKQTERDLVRSLLADEGDTVDVADFSKRVRDELLPLKIASKKSRMQNDPNADEYFANPSKYESISLPSETRGDVANYDEHIYESPVPTSAGSIHFRGQTKNYFGHTRVEDMADKQTRRVIEVQSDLFQRDRMNQEEQYSNSILKNPTYFPENESAFTTPWARQAIVDQAQWIQNGVNKLKQYQNPTAHFRMAREEIAKAVKDGKTKVQFPTGETAMKIEGLWQTTVWKLDKYSGSEIDLTPDNITVGLDITPGTSRESWIITESLGDGKFKAVPREWKYNVESGRIWQMRWKVLDEQEKNAIIKEREEEFDISGKTDTTNPIYRFYEKDLGKYLKSQYDAKPVTDDKGVTWYEVNTKNIKTDKVRAYQAAAKESQNQNRDDSWVYDLVAKEHGDANMSQTKIPLGQAYIQAIRLAPKDWTVRTQELDNGKEFIAYADPNTKEIVLSTKHVRESSAAHEAFHASLSELAPENRNEIIELAKEQWGAKAEKQIDGDTAEEFLAEEFAYYAKTQQFKTKGLLAKIRDFIMKLWDRISGKKADPIRSLYEDILSGKFRGEYESPFGKKYQSLSEEPAAPELSEIYDKAAIAKPVKRTSSFMEFMRKSFVPLDTVVGNIDPGLKAALRKFEYESLNSKIIEKARTIMESISSKLEGQKKSEDYRILDIAIKNDDQEVINYYAERLGITEDLKQMRGVLEDIFGAGQEAGMDIGYLEDYFPRTVKDSKGLLASIYGSEYGSQIKDAIRFEEIRMGRELTPDEKSGIADKMLRGYSQNGVTLTPPGNVKSRTIEQVTAELGQFYHDSMDSLAIYTQAMNENIEARKLFGKGDNIGESIGAYTIKLLAEGKITPEQEIVLSQALKARFTNKKMDPFIQSYKNLSYITTMGNPLSAITQIQDLAFSLYENGFMKSAGALGKSIVGRVKIHGKDLGITSMVHEFTEPSKLQGAVAKVFKIVWLEKMDAIGKETMINAFYEKLKESTKNGDMSDLGAFSPEEQSQIASDLQKGMVSDDIRYALFSKLLDYQPLTKSQMPEFYNTGGNERILYMLKSYTIKQIDVFRTEAFSKIADGVRNRSSRVVAEGMKNLVLLAASLAVLGVATDEIKNLILNRKTDPGDLVVDNILKIVGFSKYTVYKARQEGVSAAILSLVVPPFNIVNDPIKDVVAFFSHDKYGNRKLTGPSQLESINDIPFWGKLYYWWFGKGATKSNPQSGSATADVMGRSSRRSGGGGRTKIGQ